MDLILLDDEGGLRTVQVPPATAFDKPTSPLRSRVVYAAVHVVPRVEGDNTPGAPADIDWEATLGFRRTMWSWGLGVADAMDTAQRNMGLDPAATRSLIARTAEAACEALTDPGIAARFDPQATVADLVAAGVNTDHRAEADLSLDEIVDAYREQLAATEATGARVVLMASRHLARAARSAQDYEDVYRRVLDSAAEPVILHWLGTAFDPQLEGYFGSRDTDAAAGTLLRIINADPARIRGVKMSLLDDEAEIAVRECLPEGVLMLTGDDFHFSHLITGEDAGSAAGGGEGVAPEGGAASEGGALPGGGAALEGGALPGEGVAPEGSAAPKGARATGQFSHALLGAFAVTAPAASAAVQALDAGDPARCREILDSAERLAQHVFSAPTYHYKTGVAFLAWLNGHQRAFTMIGGMHAARSLPHLSRTIELAAATGNLENPALALERWHAMLALAGYDLEDAA